MKRSKKFFATFIALVLGTVCLFSLAACGESKLQAKLDALQAQYDNLQNQYDQQRGRLEALEHENNELRNRLENYENPNTYTDEEILAMFDLEEEARVWEDNEFVQFECDLVIVSFKKTYVYPELKLENFHLSMAERVEYLSVKPTPSLIDDAAYAERFRQTAFIYLREETREAVVTTIRELEALPFILAAGPNYLCLPD